MMCLRHTLARGQLAECKVGPDASGEWGYLCTRLSWARWAVGLGSLIRVHAHGARTHKKKHKTCAASPPRFQSQAASPTHLSPSVAMAVGQLKAISVAGWEAAAFSEPAPNKPNTARGGKTNGVGNPAPPGRLHVDVRDPAVNEGPEPILLPAPFSAFFLRSIRQSLTLQRTTMNMSTRATNIGGSFSLSSPP